MASRFIQKIGKALLESYETSLMSNILAQEGGARTILPILQGGKGKEKKMVEGILRAAHRLLLAGAKKLHPLGQEGRSPLF